MRFHILHIIFLFWGLTGRAADYFWVGGSGNWSDTRHWATTSGGAAFHSQAPGSRDNVFFNANSFNGAGQTVTIDIADAACRDMNWTGATGAPVLAGAEGTVLRVFGSLTFIPSMRLSLQGAVRLQSDPTGNLNRIITSAGQVFPADLYFDGQDGQWSMADSLAVGGTIFFERGSLNTGNRSLSCASFISDNTRSRRINLTRSVVTLRRLTGQDTVVWRMRAENLLLEARTATIQTNNDWSFQNSGTGFIEYHRLLLSGDGDFNSTNFTEVRVDTMRLARNASLLEGISITSLQLGRNFEYKFASGETFIIRELIGAGGCNGFISLRSTVAGQEAYIRSAFDFNNNYLILQDIHNGGTTKFVADNSIDLGNNRGWQINEPAPRTLFWVAGTGEWYDPAHWSRSSGGPGGECPPTPLDDVFFDARSFPGPGQIVRGEEGPQYYCHDMTWAGATGTPQLDLSVLQLYGSLALINAMDLRLPRLLLRSREMDNTLAFAGQTMQDIYAEGAGSWILQDALSAGSVTLLRGRLNTNSVALTLRRFSALLPGPVKELLLGASPILITGSGLPPAWNINNANLTITPGSSVITLDQPGAHFLSYPASGVLAYNEVLFTAPGDTAILESAISAPRFQRVRFAGSAMIYGSHEFEVLEFSPGASYLLSSGATQTINARWDLPGNPCAVINLSATLAGSRTFVRSSGAAIRASYVDMRDQQAGGGATFSAGTGSRDLGNNSGWAFPSGGNAGPGFLGADRILCSGASISLDPGIPAQGQSYRWSTGATTPALSAGQPGQYWVEIAFPSNCQIRDTVTLLPQSVLKPRFGADTTLCAGESLTLDAKITLPGIDLSYRWQDGSTQPALGIRQPGRYEVAVSGSGCTERSALQVAVTEAPGVELGPDRDACAGDRVFLNATVNEATGYRWNTGDTLPGIDVTVDGVYTVEAANGRCIGRDSVRVRFKPTPSVQLGANQIRCQGETAILDATFPGATYRWSNGATTPALTVTRSGTYDVIVDLNGCSVGDLVEISFRPRPLIELGAGREACAGDTLLLDGTAANGARPTYLWNTGAGTPTLSVSQTGLYRLEANLNGCKVTDSVQVTIHPFPVVELGADQEKCEGERVRLEATNPGATYQWNTGEQSAVIHVGQSGAYAVTVTSNGCQSRDSVRLDFRTTPRFGLGADRRPCQGETITLDATAANGPATYLWSTGATDAGIRITQTGLYSVTARAGNCSASDTVRVDYIDLPADLLGGDRQACAGQSFLLDATVPYPDAIYQWTGNYTGPTLAVSQSGLYRVDIRVGACQVSDEVRIAINPVPSFSLGADATLCEGETYDLFIPEVGEAYLWSDGSRKDAISVSEPGGLVWGEVSAGGCAFRDTIRVTFQPAPRLSLGPDTVICAERPLTLRPSPAQASVSWSTGESGRNIRVSEAGSYWAEVREGACLRRDTIEIGIRDCAFYGAYVPNAFSPDGDGINDEFRPFLTPGLIITSYRLTIMDRWGNQVFQSADPDQGWDGRVRGKTAPQGVYVYVLELSYEDDEGKDAVVESGDVTVVR